MCFFVFGWTFFPPQARADACGGSLWDAVLCLFRRVSTCFKKSNTLKSIEIDWSNCWWLIYVHQFWLSNLFLPRLPSRPSGLWSPDSACDTYRCWPQPLANSSATDFNGFSASRHANVWKSLMWQVGLSTQKPNVRPQAIAPALEVPARCKCSHSCAILVMIFRNAPSVCGLDLFGLMAGCIRRLRSPLPISGVAHPLRASSPEQKRQSHLEWLTSSTLWGIWRSHEMSKSWTPRDLVFISSSIAAIAACPPTDWWQSLVRAAKPQEPSTCTSQIYLQ